MFSLHTDSLGRAASTPVMLPTFGLLYNIGLYEMAGRTITVESMVLSEEQNNPASSPVRWAK